MGWRRRGRKPRGPIHPCEIRYHAARRRAILRATLSNGRAPLYDQRAANPRFPVYENALLTVNEMSRADRAAVVDGVSSLALMESAGSAVAEHVRRRWDPRPVVVLCGPGNNGGDGFVVARLLALDGWSVGVALMGEVSKLTGDAATNAQRWSGGTVPLSPDVLDDGPLVVDALFGAGLARPLDGVARAVVEAIDDRKLDCVAVDIPSGVHGDTGEVLGAAPTSRLTVTFFRRKPGHLLLPGREFAGEVVVADIGIPEHVLDEIAPRTFAAGPALWRDAYPWPKAGDNKYSRGHAVVVGGAEMTGAARLAAQGARRIGAGLVTVAAPPASFAVYAGGAPGTLVKPVADARAFADLLQDKRKNAVLIGPGAGVTDETRAMALAALTAGRACVLDADALSVFGGNPTALFDAITSAPCVLTPHDGEFARVFGSTIQAAGGRLARARAAAERSGAVMLLKGSDTVIADARGRAAINEGAPPELATAGSGDVLAGMILGLLAQGMGAFDAAAAAAWLHGAAAVEFGPGLIAEDVYQSLPRVLRRLRATHEPRP